MSDDRHDVQHLDDPARIRALSHPTRMRILALLRIGGPQTAALLGASIDEAPGTISYHCTRLAAVGLIEPAEPRSDDRRERWWKAAHEGSAWNLADALDDPEHYVALAALDRTASGFFAETHDRYVQQAPSMGREWVQAAGGSDRVIRLTAPELAAMVQDLEDVLDRWRDRAEQHGPEDGAEQVYVLTQAYRWPR